MGYVGLLQACSSPPFAVVISRQRRRVQLMQFKHSKKNARASAKEPPRALPRGSGSQGLGPLTLPYRRRPVPIKRFNGDILSPVSTPSPSSSLSGEKGVLDSLSKQDWAFPRAGHCLEA